MRYQLVFDAARGLYAFWWLPLVPFGFAAFFYLIREHLPNRHVLNHWRTMVIGAAVLGVAIGWMVLGSGYRLRRALETGRFRLVEGVVTDFVPGSPSGNGAESLTVRNDSQAVHFEYGPMVLTPGYHTLAMRGGVLRAGVQVRIAYVAGPTGPAIARIELAGGSADTAGRLTTR